MYVVLVALKFIYFVCLSKPVFDYSKESSVDFFFLYLFNAFACVLICPFLSHLFPYFLFFAFLAFSSRSLILNSLSFGHFLPFVRWFFSFSLSRTIKYEKKVCLEFRLNWKIKVIESKKLCHTFALPFASVLNRENVCSTGCADASLSVCICVCVCILFFSPFILGIFVFWKIHKNNGAFIFITLTLFLFYVWYFSVLPYRSSCFFLSSFTRFTVGCLYKFFFFWQRWICRRSVYIFVSQMFIGPWAILWAEVVP